MAAFRTLPSIVLAGLFAAQSPGTALAQMPDPVTGDAERGGELYRSICAECHGETGGGVRDKNSPALHQQEDWYLLAQLLKFREGIRGGGDSDSLAAEMAAKADSLPDDQAASDVVMYIKTLEGSDPMPPEIEGDVEAGKALYGMVCVACHGPDGRGMAALRSPSLVGQSDWYVVRQIENFRSGRRGADPRDITGLQMKAMMATITSDQTVLDVASFLRTLK